MCKRSNSKNPLCRSSFLQLKQHFTNVPPFFLCWHHITIFAFAIQLTILQNLWQNSYCGLFVHKYYPWVTKLLWIPVATYQLRSMPTPFKLISSFHIALFPGSIVGCLPPFQLTSETFPKNSTKVTDT